jgi:hypothetical protein
MLLDKIAAAGACTDWASPRCTPRHLTESAKAEGKAFGRTQGARALRMHRRGSRTLRPFQTLAASPANQPISMSRIVWRRTPARNPVPTKAIKRCARRQASGRALTLLIWTLP